MMLLSACVFVGIMLVGAVVGIEVTGASVLGGQRVETIDTGSRARGIQDDTLDGLDTQAVQGLVITRTPPALETDVSEPDEAVRNRPAVHVLQRLELTIGQFFSEVLLGGPVGDRVAVLIFPEADVLPPGFTLHPDGRLEGLAIECGEWRPTFGATRSEAALATYATTIFVSGCANSS